MNPWMRITSQHSTARAHVLSMPTRCANFFPDRAGMMSAETLVGADYAR